MKNWKEGLSLREVEVAEMVAEGLTDRQIGNRMGVAQGTVKVHLRNAKAILRITNRVANTRVLLARIVWGV
jgi:two-component system nitrate/nitrite response regulator NarL